MPALSGSSIPSEARPEFVAATAAEPVSAGQMVHSLARFLLAVRSRRHLLFWTMGASLLAAAAYLLVAPRYYGTNAQVLVVEADYERGTPNFASEDRWQRTLMPTHRTIVRSAKVLSKALQKLSPVHTVDFAGEPKDRWLEKLQENLSVSSLQNTNVLELRYRSKNPQAAVAIVDAILDAYMEFIEETYQGTAQEIIQLLTKEKAQLEERLAAKEAELLNLRKEVADLGYQTEGRTTHPLVQRAIDLNAKLVEARTRRISLEVTLHQVMQAVQMGADLQQYLLNVSELVGQDLIRYRLGLNTPDTTLQARLYQTLLEDQSRLQALITERGYGWAHPEVQSLQAKIRRTQEFLANYGQWVKARAEALESREIGPALIEILSQKVAEAKTLEATLNEQFQAAQGEALTLTGTLARIDIVGREVQWLRNLREVLLQRITEIDMQQKGREVRAFVIAEPELNPVPVSPDWRFVALAALGSGIGAGLALIYVVDVLDDRFRSIEEIQSLTGVPVLATVRELQVDPQGGLEGLPAYANPNSAESEAFRTLRTGLALLDHDTKLLVVTSPQPSEGKTTVVANLAVAMARAGKRTLLIDADLRRPGLTSLLKMRGREGLSGLIRAEGEMESALQSNIRRTVLENLDVLPSGPRPGNPAELLTSARFCELLAWAESVYDQVFIDCPPALATSDAIAIGRLTGAVLLVVTPAKSTRRMILRSVELFQLARIPIAGIVLNRVDSQEAGYYGYGYYGYGYDQHYGEQEEEQVTTVAQQEAKSEGSTDEAALPKKSRRIKRSKSAAVAKYSGTATVIAPAELKPGGDTPNDSQETSLKRARRVA